MCFRSKHMTKHFVSLHRPDSPAAFSDNWLSRVLRHWSSNPFYDARLHVCVGQPDREQISWSRGLKFAWGFLRLSMQLPQPLNGRPPYRRRSFEYGVITDIHILTG